MVTSKKRKRPAAVGRTSQTTIAHAIEAYLAEQRPRRRRAAASDLDLLAHFLDSYAHQSLDRAERRRFERLYDAEGPARREYCQIFGPERIAPELQQFLGWFLIRKVMARPEDLRRVAQETGQFVAWLGARGHVPERAATAGAALAAEATGLIPRAEAVADLLRPTLDAPELSDDAIEGYFRVARLAPGNLWLESEDDGRTYGPLAVPPKAVSLLSVDWRVSGAVDRVARRWVLAEVWNVYPELSQ
jgi:hypothetical protein